MGFKIYDTNITGELTVEDLTGILLHQVVRRVYIRNAVTFNKQAETDIGVVSRLSLILAIIDKINIDNNGSYDELPATIPLIATSIVLAISETMLINVDEYKVLVTKLLHFKLKILSQQTPLLLTTLFPTNILSKCQIDKIKMFPIEFNEIQQL